MEELISVIVPVYNVENYIHKCVESIVNQTYKNLEIILVDDGATDNSGKICDELAETDSRIKVIHKENGGLSDARNAGIKVAKGEYFGFIDSDDYVDEELYSVLMKNMKDTGAAVSTCGRIFVYKGDEKPTVTENIPVCMNSMEAVKEIFIRNDITFHAAWDKLYKRELFDDIEFPVGRLFEDAAIMYKIFDKAGKIVSTKKQMCYYVQRQGSISNCAYNRNKVMHQFENRINAIAYYRKNDKKKCTYAKVWNLRTASNLYKQAVEGGDREAAKIILSKTRKNYSFSVLKLAGKKIFVVSTLFCISPKLIPFMKKLKHKLGNNAVLNALRTRKSIISGYFRNKEKYKGYDENTVFVCGVPEHGNRGDQAISLAEVNYISAVMPECKIVTIPETEILQHLSCLKKQVNKYNSLIIGHGGGNMGELYPFQEKLRLKMLKNLKNAKIVIFPQSIDYSGEGEFFRKSQKLYNSHKNLAVFTREDYSEKLRQKYFPNCKGGLVPDIVLSYKPELPDFERNGILFCTRQDKEKNQQSERIISVLKNTAEKCGRKISYTDTYSPDFACEYSKQLGGLNEIWTEFKNAELVVTDRLHGMIFCVITGTPCIAVDNSTGKVGNLHRTWLKSSGVVYISDESDIRKGIDVIENEKYEKTCLDDKFIKAAYEPLKKALLGE